MTRGHSLQGVIHSYDTVFFFFVFFVFTTLAKTVQRIIVARGYSRLLQLGTDIGKLLQGSLTGQTVLPARPPQGVWVHLLNRIAP